MMHKKNKIIQYFQSILERFANSLLFELFERQLQLNKYFYLMKYQRLLQMLCITVLHNIS
jgi:hypothetical protein